MKALRISLWTLGAGVLALAALLGAGWLWSGSDTSLATALAQLARWLPADQTLQVQGVQGSLRTGGSIASLRWQRAGLDVQARALHVDWSLRPLLDGELQLGRVSVGQLRIEDTAAAAPLAAPADLVLPLKLTAAFSVDTLDWVGPPALRITGFAGHYRFDGEQHHFDADSVHIASGQYSLQGQLQARTPMALALQLHGVVQTALPSSQKTLTVQAQAQLQGTLAGSEAALQLQAQLQPQLPDASAVAPANALQASVSARILPWQPQPVSLASARWQGLNLAALWPQAPQTLLAGRADVTPVASGWQANVTLTNARPGPWNQQQLPLQALDARLQHEGGRWAIESLQAEAGGGHITAQAQMQATPAAPWQGSASVQGINLAALDTRLAPSALDGKLNARPAAGGIAFDAQLQPSPGPPPKGASAAGLRLRSVQAKGQWSAPLLTLEALTLQTDDAQLLGALSLHTDTLALQGRLDLSLPGASLALQGQLGRASGKGDLTLRVSDAALATRWWMRWPGAGVPALLASASGSASLTGHWDGGWQDQGQELQLQASLSAPRLDLGPPSATSWRLRELQTEVTGSVRALHVSTHALADQGSRSFSLQAQADAGRHSDGAWKARLLSAQLGAQDSLQPGLWSLQLNEAVALDWQPRANPPGLSLGAGSVRLSGPVPGSASIQWQALSHASNTSAWRSQGSVHDLPLAWLDLLGRTQMANLRLRGDLLFGGTWDANIDDSLRVRATLQRSAGDLHLQTDDANAPLLSAGVRTALLQLSADGAQVAASLRWDSERAGQLQADVSSQLSHVDGAWRWPADAPLTGTVHAQLPPVGAWSLLAPPGWRLRGTLDAHATLSGTRTAPQWRGSVQAQDLALRSVADGLDFSHGTLRATVEGQRLDIVQCTLQGAGGSTGGLLSITGSAQWLDPTEVANTASSRLRMALDVQLQALRVSARADRRLVLSGQLSAHLAEQRLTLRGQLKADQALFILPDDSTPELGDDVVVRAAPNSAATTSSGPAAAPVGLRITPDVALTLDLGSDFELRGRGLNTRLAGSLELRNSAQQAWLPRLSGELRAVGGSYKAYGQQLDIEQGVLRFAGPYDNPALDILALRPNLPQRVGVQISGTALSPVVRLYAEPDLPDAEKLAWLVLGRTAANGGAEAAVLQQAALALLGGNAKGLSGGVAQALGLDELSVRGSASNADGTTTAASVTLGKRVSRNFYVAYERSLAGTLGTFYIFYDLSRRFTLRAQTGEQSAIDLIFTLRYD